MLESCVRNNVHNFGSVLQAIELIESKEARPSKIGFLPEDAVELDGVADGFVDLQSKLVSRKDQRAGALRTLRGGMQCDRFFGYAGGVPQQIERLDEFISLQRVLPAKAIRIGPLLDLIALKRRGRDAAAGLDLALMNARAN